jgi:hypothetical protein
LFRRYLKIKIQDSRHGISTTIRKHDFIRHYQYNANKQKQGHIGFIKAGVADGDDFYKAVLALEEGKR